MNKPMRSWFAVTAKPRHEKAVAQNLRMRGLEEYLPLYSAERRWSDRMKRVDLPLFAGYVFCHFGYPERLAVLNTPGVTSIVGFGQKDAPIESNEIEAVRTILASGLPVEPWMYLRSGDMVCIARGPLAGLAGTLLRVKTTWRVVVSVELLQRSVAVEVDRDLVMPLPGPPQGTLFQPQPVY